VTFQVIATAALALVLSFHLSWVMNRWLLFVLLAIGLLLGAAYSVKPVQLKGRGLAQLICLWLIIFVGPMLFVGLLVDAVPSLSVLIFAAAYGTLQMGIILVNTAEDYPEDLSANITTSIVALGLHRGIGLAFWLVVTGAAGVLTSLIWMLWQRGSELIWILATLPAIAACIYVIASVGGLRSLITGASLEDSIRTVKHAAKRVPLWVTIVAWSLLGASYALFYSGHK